MNPDNYHAGDWDGDPLTLPPHVVKQLKRDEGLAARTFQNRCEAFNAGLEIGAAGADPGTHADTPDAMRSLSAAAAARATANEAK